MPSDRFANKVAVVTGGSSGIGYATCVRLHAEGACVVMAARRPDVGEEAPRRIGGDRIAFKSTEVTDRAQLDALFDFCGQRFGRLDVLVNNAGIARVGRFDAMSKRTWQRLVDVNLGAVFDACQAAIPHLRNAHDTATSRAIVNVASLTSVAGEPGMAVYAATKAGVLNFTRSLALELIGEGIRVNAVSPGAVDTPLSALSTGTPHIAAAFHGAIPIGRFARPDEIAAAAWRGSRRRITRSTASAGTAMNGERV